jgi:hypothetical protein
MVALSKAVWVQTFGFSQALFPYEPQHLNGAFARCEVHRAREHI